MDPETRDYLIFLLLAVVLVVADGQLIRMSGKAYLEQAYHDRSVAASVNRLVIVLFHLFVLGLLALISVIEIDAGNPVQTIVVKLGIVLLVLALAHWITMGIYSRRRARQQLTELAVMFPTVDARHQEVLLTQGESIVRPNPVITDASNRRPGISTSRAVHPDELIG